MMDETITVSMRFSDALLTRPDGPDMIAHQIWKTALTELHNRQRSITIKKKLN